MKEEWKDVPTWNGIFQVSNYGRVYNTKTKNYLTGYVKSDGYIIVTLNHNKRREAWRLNRLIATVWQRPLLKTEDAHHKNKFKWCNCIWNIEILDEGLHTREHKKGNKYRLGKKHSQQSKKKISQASIGNKKRLGHKHTDETKKKISLTLRNKRKKQNL